MKITKILVCVFLCLSSILKSEESAFKITYETICIKEIIQSMKYNSLENFFPGHHKTVIRLENYQDEQEFALTVNRDFFDKMHQNCAKKILYTRCKYSFS